MIDAHVFRDLCVYREKREREREDFTESSELLLEVRIITVGVLEVAISQKLLHNKLVREGLAKS